MTRDRLTVLLVEDDPDYATLVQLWMSAEDYAAEFILNWTDTVAAAKARIERGGVDVVLLDLSLPDSEGIATFRRLRAIASDLPVIALTAGSSEALALEMIQHGAQDYLAKSTCTAAARVKAIRYAHLRQTQQTRVKDTPPGRMIAVAGATGGVGTTTLASLLATELRVQTGARTLLVDLVVPGGMASFYLGMQPPKYTVIDALRVNDRLDVSLWNTLVALSAEDLHLLASPPQLNIAAPRGAVPAAFSAPELPALLEFIGGLYPWVVLDLGCLTWLPPELASAHMDVFLVSACSIPSLHQATQMLASLDDVFDRERVHLTVADADKGSIQTSELSDLFGSRAVNTLPWDPGEVHEALLRKRLPADGVLRRQVAEMARQLAGIGNSRKKRRFGPLFSLLNGHRHPAPAAGIGAR